MLSSIINDRKLSGKQKGFTIIEVMIVLAVAALIILIVLLAVPALQRSSRNTSIKSDASTVASGISAWETNNNGELPQVLATDSPDTGTVTIAGASSANPDTVKVQGSTVVALVTSLPVPSSASGTGKIAPGEVQAWSGHRCSSTPGSPTAADYTANNRAVAVFYDTEAGGSTPQLQCIDT